MMYLLSYQFSIYHLNQQTYEGCLLTRYLMEHLSLLFVELCFQRIRAVSTKAKRKQDAIR